MPGFFKPFLCIAAFLSIAAPVLAQQVIGNYRAEIDAIDRVNSGGQPLDGLAAFLTQDRANVHRFDRAQAGDTRDGLFDRREMRATLWRFLQRGSVSPAAQAAVRAGGNPVLEVTIWGQGGSVSHLTVDLADAAGTVPATAQADAPLSAGELAQAATRIQAALNDQGFDAGPVDGQPGQRTRDAIAAFQRVLGAPATGTLTRSQLAALTDEGGQPPAETATVADGGGAEFAAADGLVTMQGRLLWSSIPANSLRLPQGQAALEAHEDLIARRLIYTGWDAAADDLVGGLKGVDSIQFLTRMVELLPETAAAEVADLALSLADMPEGVRTVCEGQVTKQRFNCGAQRLETEFDRRRLRHAMAEVIGRVAEARKFDTPVPVHVLCPLGRIDAAYDFDAGTVDLAAMIGAAQCVNTNKPIRYLSKTPVEADFDLASGVPQTVEMEAERVERLARGFDRTDEQGQRRYTPLMLAFDGEITVARTEGQADARGFHPVAFTLRRTGPVTLRSSAAPEEAILRFGEQSADTVPSAGPDLGRAAVAFGLIEGAPEVSTGGVAAALESVASGAGTLVRIPTYLKYGDADVASLSVENLFNPETPAERAATLSGLPLAQVGWTQRLSRTRGVPDTELVLLFPAPYDAYVSQPIDAEVTEAARRGDRAYMLARMSQPMRMQGAAGPALVAAIVPLGYEVSDTVVGNQLRVIARPGFAQEVSQAAPAQAQIFLPSAWWFAMKAAELGGHDLDTHIGAVLDRANLFRGDTFGRLDAVEAVRGTLDGIAATQTGEPWVAGGLTLGAYDLEARGWPVQGIGLVLPTRDDLERSIARRVTPAIRTRGLFLPMPMEEARRFQEEHGGARQLDFYATITLSASDGLAPEATLREVLIFAPTRSSSQRMRPSPGIDRDAAIARFVLPGAEAEAPVAPVAAAAPAPAPAPEPEPAPAVQSADPAPAAPDTDWPEVPEVEVARGARDLLGLRTGMSVAEAQAVILGRGGVLAAFERPFEVIDPAVARETASVQALAYRRLYVASDGTEAISIAAPGPEGPVLAIKRRLQLPRGTLPFETIRGAILEKYGPPGVQGAAGEPIVWFSGTPGPQQAICRANLQSRVRIERWTRLGDIGTPGFDASARPAAWEHAIPDFPVRYAELMVVCGELLVFAPVPASQTGGGDAFSMLMVDTEGLLRMDEAMAGLPAPGEIEIDF